MLAAAIIVFRESLEAALVVAVILGATRGLRGRGAWIAAGSAAGALGAGLAAALMGRISEAVSGAGQPLFEAAILLSAVAMLGWHNVWMSRHARRMTEDLKALGREAALGRASMLALACAAGLAVLREGSEVALFLYGLAASGAGARALVAG
ncbi:MAG: FTR1 family protein, partial [Elusimicrobia bacterium]|nr:FTR1 family protein [Elusimicrobiota bacterium]